MNQPAEKETGTGVAVLPEFKQETALVAFSTDQGLDPFLEQVAARARAEAAKLDISTPAGRAAIASLAYKVAQTKTGLDKLKKSLTAEEKAKLARIDAEGSRAWDHLEKLQKEIRAPLTEWEQADEKRRAAHEFNIARIQGFVKWEGIDPTAEQIIGRLDDLKPFVSHEWEEFKARAEKELNDAVRDLTAQLARRQKADAQAAELKRLQEEEAARVKAAEEQRIRDEEAARVRREEEEKAKAEAARIERERAYDAAWAEAHLENAAFDRAAADLKAENERKALQKAKDDQEEEARKAAEVAAQKLKDEQDARRKAEEQAEKDRLKAAADKAAAEKKAADDLKAAQEKAERDKAAAVQAEKDRVAREQAAAAEETRKREANLAHKRKINKEALAAIKKIIDVAPVGTGPDNDVLDNIGRGIITAIAEGKIPHVTIKY